MISINTRILLASISLSLIPFVTPTTTFAAIQSLNGLTGNNQTFQNDANITISSASHVHTIGWQGYLPVSRGGTGVGSFTTGSILFSNGSVITQDNSNLFWDNSNKRLGIGTSSPTSALDVSGSEKVSGNLDVTGNISAANFNLSSLVPYTGATGNVNLGSHNLSATSLTSTADSVINGLSIGIGGGSIPSNTVVGKNAMTSSPNGGDNTAVGFSALGSGSNGEQSTAIGSQTLSSNTTGSYNTAVGYRSLWLNTSGIRNVSVGMSALSANTTGNSSVALGFGALGSNTTSSSNVAIGDNAGAHVTGGNNVVVGAGAAFYQADGSTSLTTAGNGVYIGNSVQGYDNNDFNSIVLGWATVGAGANKTVIGNSSMTDVYMGSSSSNANVHAKKLYLGSTSTPGCIIMGDTSGGVGYITLDSGSLTVSTTPPTACQ